MQCPSRFPRRFVRCISVAVCLALVFTSLTIGPNSFLKLTASAQLDQSNGKARKVKPAPPESGAPPFALPNLDEIRSRPQTNPEAPPPIPSSVRSKRKPLKLLRMRAGREATAAPTGTARVRSGNGSDPLASTDSKARQSAARSLHHARRSYKSAIRSLPLLADDQYVQHFLATAIPNYQGSEVTYWTNILRSANEQGLDALLLAVGEMGRTIFESAAYAERARTNHEYVDDLYQTYMMREPDTGGLYYWEHDIVLTWPNGRAILRDKFLGSGPEFHDLVATLTPNGAISGAVSSIASALVDPFNQTGDQLAARDCEWSLPLISLPGRAGLDLGLGLSYSSMVWTRSGPSQRPYLYFDEDYSLISPGFRLGFASIQGPYFDALVGKKIYMLISSSGRRVELRQTTTPNVYESADSSYLQLTDNSSSTSSLLLRATDGTQIKYEPYSIGWQATEVKDRNGNYLSILIEDTVGIKKITDTLGREIEFHYDEFDNLSYIDQAWNGTTHEWASFDWGAAHAMNVSGFTGASVVGTYTGEQIPMLGKVRLADGSYYVFEYTGAGQAQVIRRYTIDNVQRSFTYYDYDNSNSDCPRLIDMWTWADRWTGINGLPTEAMTTFTLPGDGSHQMTAPDGTIYKDFYGSEWQKGLVTRSEVWSNTARVKLSLIGYEHDGGLNAPYPTNPRVNETNVSDWWDNHRRTRMTYTTFGLLSDVYEYDANGSTVLRRSHTDYDLDSSYTNLRLIGLARASYVCDGAQGETPCGDTSSSSLQAKTAFFYDEGNPTDQGAVRHDTDFGSSYHLRGNLTSTRRYNVNSLSQYTFASLQYNTNGSVISTSDSLGHTSYLSYADSYSVDGTNNTSLSFTTLAYPTTITDADGFSTSVKYHYDFGGRTRVQGPPPAGQTQGAIQTTTYDGLGRIERVTNGNNGAYTRYQYGEYYVFTYASVNNVADEASSTAVFDGLGRMIGTASNHPGSIGGYSAQNTQYDIMGRVKKQSNPTEVNGNWVAIGDDAEGWYYTQQTYDWKGRPLLTTHSADGSIRYASYAGCGCAGGEVATFTDEENRKQKVYSDVLARTWKTEVLNWNGTVCSTNTNTFNVRDQITNVRQTENATGVYQDTVMTYGGYARLHTKHVSEQQDQNGNPTHTTYVYNADDTIQSVTDARDASATYIYNNGRHLVNEIHYSAPSGITETSNVTFGYDAAGNRTSMTDGLGSKTYSYNPLSQLMSETRTFADPNNAAINGVVKTLSYDYNLAGGLKKITDSTNMTINYGYDSIGRLNGVTGSGNLYADVSNYASNFQYRAWGGLKAMTDGGNHTSSLSYNTKLQPSQFDISGNVVHQTYDYYDDGRLSFVHNTTDANFDRGYSYDHLGRLTEATSGGVYAAPYYETFGYDASSNLTSRYTSSWNQDEFWDGATYSNNKRDGWGYDADGRNTTIATRTYTFDAAGRTTLMTGQKWLVNHYVNKSQAAGYDGDGVKLKDTTNGVTSYYLTSSVLRGAIIEELSSGGQKNVGYIYGTGGRLLARQSSDQVTWTHTTPAGTGKYDLFAGGGFGRVEFDPLGADVGLTAPETPDTNGGQGDLGGHHVGGLMDSRYSDMFNLSAGCTIDGMAGSCSQAMDLANRDVGVEEPEERTVAMLNPLTGQFEPTHFVAKADGWSGYMPHSAVYDGAGNIPWYWPKEEDDNGGPTGPRKVRLETEPQNTTSQNSPIDAARAALESLGRDLVLNLSDDCRKNVISKLQNAFSDFDSGEFGRFVWSQQSHVYDGTTSNLPIGQVTSPQVAAIEFPGAREISDAFSSNPGLHALTSVTSLTLSIYVQPSAIITSNNGINADNKALFFHEAIHGYGGLKGGTSYFDDQIQKAFGLKVDPKNTKNITDYIRKHCF
jgi:RHS Repeat/Domain of unknown function (DUF4214)